MAAVEVFVDDAVRGRLPQVCVKTGEPADLDIVTSRSVGERTTSLVWLLVFLGPLGWLALFLFLALGPGPERLTVRLPYTRAAWDRERHRRQIWILLGMAGVVAWLVALVDRQLLPLVWLAAGAGLLLAAFVVWSLAYFDDIGISLDASRRWVTLTRVHEKFAAAAAAEASRTRV